MKFRIFFIFVLILGALTQFGRTTNSGKFFSPKQKKIFTQEKTQNTNFKFENEDKYLIFFSENSQFSKNILYNLEKVFEFSKNNFEKVEMKEKVDTGKYKYFIFATDEYYGLRKEVFENIKSQVKNFGGTIFLLNNTTETPFRNYLDIENFKNFKYVQDEGLNFPKGFFPGIESLKPNGNLISHYSYENIILGESVEVVAESDRGIPIILEQTYGKGRIIFLNSSFLEWKLARGVLSQLIAYGSDWHIGVTLNSKVVHIDDFPAPIPRYEEESLLKSYGMDTGDFFENIWWKDMKSLAHRRDLIYSGFAIIDYNNSVSKEEIKELPKITYQDLNKRSRELFLERGELGLHGYNHNPLVYPKNNIDLSNLDYSNWKSEEDSEFAISHSLDILKEILGEDIKIYSYVPPSNILTEEGKKVLVKSLPDLKVISAVFYDSDSPGAFVTEVERDREVEGLYYLPRFTSGFSNDEENKWLDYNALAVYGYYSHFIHPDDILSGERSRGKDWEKIYSEFEENFVDLQKNFPYLEPITNIELLERYINIENLEISSKKVGNKIQIGVKNFSKPFYINFRVRENEIKNVVGGEFNILKKYENNSLYLIKITSPDVTIELKGE